MADDPLVKAISGLTLVTQKMADEQEKEVEAAEKARKERIKELNDIDKEQKAEGKGNRKEAVRARAELEKIKNETKANKKISEEVSRSTASALGINTAELKLRKDQAVALNTQTKALEVLADEIKQSGGDPEKNEEYLKRSSELQAQTNALAGKSLTGMEADRHNLEQMRISIEAQGGVATDNKKYNELSLDIQQKQLDLRRDSAETPAAKKAIAEEQKQINAQQAGLLGRIARGMDFLKDSAKDKMKKAGKGLMVMLKGTLIAGFLVALIAFLNSKYWEDTKEWLVGKGLPMLKNLWETISNGFGKIADFVKDPSLDSFLNLFSKDSALVAAIALIVSGLAVATFLGPFKAGIGLLKTALGGVGKAAAALIPGMGGKDKKPGGTKTKKTKGSKAGSKFASVIANIAKGIGKGIQAILTGLARGLAAFANPSVLIGAGILAGVILVIGAGIAGAAYLLGKSFPTLTAGLKSFEGLDGEKLKTVAIGIGAIGLALFALGVGGAMQGAGSMVGAITGSIGKFFGAKDPLVQLKKFSEAKIDAAQAKKNAEAMVAYAKAMSLAGGATAVEGIGAFIGGITGSIGKFFGAEDPLTKLVAFGAVKVNAAQVKANAAAMVDYAKAMNEAPAPKDTWKKFISAGLGALAKAFGAESATLPSPFDALIKFGAVKVNAANVKANADAMVDYGKAMEKAPTEKVNFAGFVNGVLGSLSGFLGAKKAVNPLQALINFGAVTVDTAKVKANAEAMIAYGKAMKGAPPETAGFKTFISGALGSLSDFLGIGDKKKSPLQALVNFGTTEVNTARVKLNAAAMIAYGNAMAKVPKPEGGWAAIGTFVGGVFSSLGKLVGLAAAKSPLQKLKEFGDFIIGKEALARIPLTAQAMIAYGNAMAKVPKPTGGWDAIGNLFGGMAEAIGGVFSSDKKNPLDQLKKFGEMAINAVGVKANANAFVDWAGAMGKGAPKIKDAFTDFEIDSDAVKALETIEKHPLTALQKFSDKAFMNWVKAMREGAPILKKAFKGFKISRGAATALDKFAKLGEAGAGLALVGPAIKILAENMSRFMEAMFHLKEETVDNLRAFLKALSTSMQPKSAKAMDAAANLVNAMAKIDSDKFEFPIPKETDIEAYETFTKSVTKALDAIKKLPKGMPIPAATTPAAKAAKEMSRRMAGKKALSPAAAAGAQKQPGDSDFEAARAGMYDWAKKLASTPAGMQQIARSAADYDLTIEEYMRSLALSPNPITVAGRQPYQIKNAQKTAELREHKLDAAGSQATSGVNVVNAPVVTNAPQTSTVNLTGTPTTDRRTAALAASN